MSRFRAHQNRNRFGAVLVVIWLLVPLLALCQSQKSGQISGTVAAVNASPLAGAQLILRSSAGNVDQRRATTDRDGRYSFSDLPFGEYKLSAMAPGYRDSEIRTVILNSATVTSDLTLTPLLSPSEGPKMGGVSQKSPPSFTASGARGTIAPSGYSTGLRSEEVAHFSATANAMGPTIFSTLAAVAADCGQEPILLRAVESAPRDFAANRALGSFYLGHANYSRGIQYLGVAHTLSPADFANSRDLAAALIGGGRGADAATLLQRLLVEHANDSTLLRLLAFAYRSTGENEKSIATFQKAATTDASADNQYDCGVGLIQLAALSQALELFTEATNVHPESARDWLGLGIAEHLLAHKEKASSALLRSADSDHNFFPPLALLAELSSLPDQTNADLRRRVAGYLAAHPNDAEAHLVYALTLRKQPEQSANSRQEIVSQLKRALQLDPRLARAHFLLGDLESEVNNLSGAIDEFVAGSKLQPENAEGHYRLSLLYRRVGQQEAARKEMDIFQSLRGRAAAKTSTDSTAAASDAMQPIQLVPAQRGCDVEP
jgi:tetratricopeptide (TPR) repeat protein